MNQNLKDAPPHNLEAEASLLGAMLLSNDVIGIARQYLNKDSFYKTAHQEIFQTVVELHEKGQAVDLVLLKDELGRTGRLEKAGGLDYLMELEEAVPCIENAKYYAGLVREYSAKRRLLNLSIGIREKSLNGVSVSETLEFIRGSISMLAYTGKSEPKLLSAQDILDHTGDGLFWVVNDLIPQGGLVMISGKPGVGKTWLGLLLARAVSEGLPFLGRLTTWGKAAYVDLENSRSILRDRLARIRPMAVEFAPAWAMEKPFSLWDKDIDHWAREGYLIILDSLVRAHGVDENSAQEMARVMGRLRELSHMGATIVFLHHKGKSQENEYRGSSDILAGVDVAYLLDREDGHLELKTIKSRVGEDLKIPLRLEIAPGSVELRDLTQEIQARRQEQESGQLEALAEEIKDLASGGKNPTQSEIVGRCKEKMEWGRNTTLNLIKKGDGRYWEGIRATRNSPKLYKIRCPVVLPYIGSKQEDNQT